MNLRINGALTIVLALLTLSFTLQAAEAPKKKSPIEGTWLWSFTNADGGQVSPRVRFSMKNNELIGTSRFRAGAETPVTNLTFQGDQITFDVVRFHNDAEVVTHYAGRLNGDTIQGKLSSKAGGETRTYDWVARRPVGVDGAWKVSIATGGEFPIESRLTLKQEGEKITGKLKGRGPESDIRKGRIREGNIYFEVERAGRDGEKSTNRYRGKLVSDELRGTVEMNRFGGTGRQTNDWDAVRAD